jgi:hypothetical protein
MIDWSFLKESGFGAVVFPQFGDLGGMAEAFLRDVAIIQHPRPHQALKAEHPLRCMPTDEPCRYETRNVHLKFGSMLS